MKKYEVYMDLTISVTVEVEAENESQAGQMAMEKVADNEAYYVRKYDSLIERNVTEVHECEEQEPEQLTFKELCDRLQYFSVDDPQTMTIDEICQECRDYIRKHGHCCTDENLDFHDAAEEWVDENHPEWDVSGFGWSVVLYNPLEFLCEDRYTADLHFAEMQICFYGDWDKGIGVFNVEH